MIRGLNSIKNKKVYEKLLTLRQNMRDNLSNKNINKLFILSLKKLSESIESCYSQKLFDENNVQNIQSKICPKDDLKIAIIFKKDLALMLHILSLTLYFKLDFVSSLYMPHAMETQRSNSF